MSDIKNVQLYGDQTGGGGAIPLNYILANGWKIQFSASITLSPLKENIENGIMPDMNIFISSINEVNGVDPILERAFLTLK
jgi:C-terminal processing protease CtpA/Prc